ncbi:substrate-binding domain-containing protein [Nocardia asteroides]|nr:substrate-binding domain-containing protein [Nocardia asteroides]
MNVSQSLGWCASSETESGGIERSASPSPPLFRPSAQHLSSDRAHRQHSPTPSQARPDIERSRSSRLEPPLRNGIRVITGWARDGVTAVCTQNDETAFSVLHGVREAGLHCPQDMAAIGVDAIPLGAVSTPPLTSIGLDAGTIIELSVSAMMAELGFAPPPPHTLGTSIGLPHRPRLRLTRKPGLYAE